MDERVESIIARSLRTTAGNHGAMIQAIGVMPDHVHVAVSIPPNVAISTVVGRMKGAASHAVNEAHPGALSPFAWQSEYGVLSFGERHLPDVIAYVDNQPARHAANQIWPISERVTDQL